MSESRAEDHPIDAVLFDYGGVLTTSVDASIDEWLRADGVGRPVFDHVLQEWGGRADSPIAGLETGALSTNEFESWFADALRDEHGRTPKANGLLGRMFAEMKPDAEMLALVRSLRDRGTTVGLLSNSWARTYPMEELRPLFHDIVISGDVGFRKPEVEIFALSLTRLGVGPDRALFIDDSATNVVGARRAGLRAWRHEDPATTRRMIAELIPD